MGADDTQYSGGIKFHQENSGYLGVTSSMVADTITGGSNLPWTVDGRKISDRALREFHRRDKSTGISYF